MGERVTERLREGFARLAKTLRSNEPTNLVRLKLAFLVFASLAIYSIVGGYLIEGVSAPLAHSAWFAGTAILVFYSVQAVRSEGLMSVGAYVTAHNNKYRRLFVFLIQLWACTVLSAEIARIMTLIGLDQNTYGYEYRTYTEAAPGTVAVIGIVIIVGLFCLTGRRLFPVPPDISREHLRGADFSTKEAHLTQLKNRYETLPAAAELAGIPFPPGHERMHTAISASTGAGKTTALRGLLATIRARGDRAVVLDNNSEFLRSFRQAGDIVMSPFDKDSPGWRLSNETQNLHDWDRLASSFVPKGSGSSAEWHAMATAFFGAVGSGLWEVHDGSFSLREFQRLLVSAEARELAPLVSGTTAEVLASDDEHNSRRLQSVRMSFIDALKSWRSVKDGDFSFRRWVGNQGPDWLFLPYSDYEADLARHLLSAWVDIMVISALDRPNGEAPSRTTWIIVDELNSLGEIPALLVGATRLRKAGFAIVVAVQDFAQLRETYGDNRAETLMNNFSNKLVLRTTDASAAENLSKQLGEREMFEDHTNFSTGQSGSLSQSTNMAMERLVLPSEIQNLPDLEGYLNFAGDWPVIKVKVPT